MVLIHIVCALAGAVESYTVLIGLVVEYRRPVRTGAALPRAGSVVRSSEDMVESKGHHIVHCSLAGGHHDVLDRLDELLVISLCGDALGLDEGLAYPLVGDLLGAESRVPAEAAEHVPVGLGEDVAGEVGVLAGIGHAGHAFDHLCHGRAFAIGISVAVKALLVSRAVINEMVGESEVLLGDLELHHHLGLVHLSEEGIEGLARLEVDGTVLDLNEDVVGEQSVKVLELFDGLVGAVGAGRAVDEGTPHDDAAVGADGLSQHVGAVGVCAAVVLRAGLALGVGLHQEASEVRDGRINLISLVLPPLADLGIERVAARQSAEGDGAGPLDGQVSGNAVFAQDVGDLRHARDMLSVEDQGIGVDVVEGRAVDADGCAEFAVFADACFGDVRRSPLPHGPSGIAALDGVVEVVPMVEDAVIVVGLLPEVHPGAGLAEDLGALQGVDAVADAGLGAAGHDALAGFVIDVEFFLCQGVVHLGVHRCEDFLIWTRIGEPEVGPVLVRRFRRTAGCQYHQQAAGNDVVESHIVMVVLINSVTIPWILPRPICYPSHAWIRRRNRGRPRGPSFRDSRSGGGTCCRCG